MKIKKEDAAEWEYQMTGRGKERNIWRDGGRTKITQTCDVSKLEARPSTHLPNYRILPKYRMLEDTRHEKVGLNLQLPSRDLIGHQCRQARLREMMDQLMFLTEVYYPTCEHSEAFIDSRPVLYMLKMVSSLAAVQ